MTQPPLFAFVIPAYNAASTLRSCLHSVLAAADVTDAEVVVVDHGSTDGTRELLAGEFEGRVRLVDAFHGEVGAVRNLGAQATAAPVVAFIDADCVIPADYVARAQEAIHRWGADATGSEYSLPNAPGWIERCWHSLHSRPQDGPVAYLNAGNLVVRRTAFDAVGGFDQTLRTGEDAEFGQRLRASGFRIIQDHSVRAIHLGNPRSLRAFSRQQWWHGLGMFGTARRQPFDKPLLMTLGHLVVAVGIPVGALVRGVADLGTLGALFAAGNFPAPAVTVLFRRLRNHSRAPIGPSLLLYALYYWCRIIALSSLIIGIPKPSRGRR